MEDFGDWRPESEKLLVTGVEGVVGANLALSLSRRFEVVGLFSGGPVSLPGCMTTSWQPHDAAAWRAFMRRQRPQWIIHCGPLACCSWDLPQKCPDAEQETHTCAQLAQTAAESESRLTVISSDAVFAGPRLFHDERAPTSSRQPFARAISRVEEALEATGAMVVRTHAYGWSPAGAAPGFAERVWESLIEGNSATFDPHQHATPILASHLAELLLLAYRRGLRGRYHIAGAERTSAWRFAEELGGAFGLRGAEVSVDEGPPPGGVPAHLHETSLATRRAQRELASPMPMLREGLDAFADQAADGYRARLQCGVARTAVTADAA
ncbi:MAG: sugar nucleotide-binding protein [Planctomycetes bacterium]|nr:sugar nucleotide-binding protein [Planctomycetota bacterium]